MGSVSGKISRPLVQAIAKKSSSSPPVPQVTKMELEDDPPVPISTQPESPTEPLSTFSEEPIITPTVNNNYQPEVDEKFFRSDNPLMYVAGLGVISVGGTMIYFASE